jgi:phosphotransferase system  glucose/maltose/N-acetylglucosamine-specific IIC component
MAPIKIIMVAGILLTLLQAISMFFKSYAAATGKDIT